MPRMSGTLENCKTCLVLLSQKLQSNVNDHLCVELLIVNYALQIVPQVEISMYKLQT